MRRDVRRPLLPRLAAFTCFALVAGCTGSAPGSPAGASSNPSTSSSARAVPPAPATGVSMEQLLSVHAWVRSGASVCLARIEKVDVQPGSPGQQITRLTLRIEASLFGPRGDEVRTASILEPASATARLKLPAPVWGAIALQKGTSLVLVVKETGPDVTEPLFARQVQGPADPFVVSLRDLLLKEASAEDGAARRARYLEWISAGTAMERLFGAEALSRDEDLPRVDPEGDVAITFARVLGAAGTDPLQRGALFGLAFPSVYERTNEAGRVALIGALFAGAADPSEEVRRAALDALSDLPEKDLDLPGLTAAPGAAPHIEERIAEETDPATKARLRRWLEKARGPG